MKIFLILTIAIFLLNLTHIYPQSIAPINCSIVTTTVPSGTYPSTTSSLGIYRDGIEKTAHGTLRVLVVYVRFSDDTENTTYWPNYNVLPAWAQNTVDSQIPSNNIYSQLNVSNYFDRSSGGDGQGTLGDFQVIGDVYYVTTDNPRSSYTDGQAVYHVLEKLDDPSGSYNIDFRLYDNWEFMKGNVYYTHEYRPFNPSTGTGGDGELDHVFIMFRQPSRLIPTAGGYMPMSISSNFTSNDSVLVNANSGSAHFNFKGEGPYPQRRGIVFGPAHEYGHFLLGRGHFDSQGGLTQGNVQFFSMMVTSGTGHVSAHERYRLGWLDTDLRDYNQSSYSLEDTHKDNTALMIPIRYSGSDLKEYFLVENYQTTNSYSNANPFLTTSVFNHTFSKGILIYHVENEDKNTAVFSLVDIECADGLWNWNLATGSSTPTDRSDDLIQMNTPAYNSGQDERDFITINVGGTVYNDYMALTESSFGGNPPANHGRRYNSDDFLGDTKDFFEKDYVEIFSKWSNPKTDLSGGGTSNTGIQVLTYNSSTHAYTLKIAVDESAIQSMPPSKPQNLKMAIVSNHPQLSWDANTEPDLAGYNIYRQENTGNIVQIGYVPKAARNLYTDTEALTNLPYDNITYTIKAKDTDGLLSVSSDAESVMAIIPEPNFGDEDKIVKENYNFSLNQNYPNPFNPSTEIKYALKENTFVVLKIFDVLGSEISVLKNEYQSAGSYAVRFDARKLSSGIYFYTITAGNFRQTKKMILLR